MPAGDEKPLRFENFTLDPRRGCLRDGDGEIDLRPKSFEVLRYLVNHAGRLVPKDEIMRAVWGDVIVSDESLTRCVSDIRQALRDREQRIIRTVPRRGYLFDARLESVAGVAAEAEAAALVTAGPAPPPERNEALPAEHRPLTVLSGELVGLAALASWLDPETLRAMTADWRHRRAAVISRHHGTLVRQDDDALLIWFGYPFAREHDAEHAVAAGLALRDAVARHAEHWRQPLQARLGIASGVVVMDELADGEPIAIGQSPHLAPLLRLGASAGELVIDHRTRELVGGLFSCDERAPLPLDEQTEPVRNWRVHGPGRPDSRFEARQHRDVVTARPRLSRFVGRSAELDLLAERISAASGVRVVDIVGEPGIGKSRLLREFRQRLPAGARVWPGDCWPDSEQVPFRPFIDRIGHGDSETIIAGKLEAGLAQLGLGLQTNLGLLMNLFGLQPPADALRGLDDVLIGMRTRDLLLRMARAGANAAPLVVILEDLHWIDGASRDLLARLITLQGFSLTLVHTRRPDVAPPPWVGAPTTLTMTLGPLTEDATAQIVRGRLEVAGMGGLLTRLIVERAEGNPLFAEEIANFLLEGGMVRHGRVSLEYDTAAIAAAMPASLRLLLTARADRLPPADRTLVQAAAVIGRRFAPHLLAAITGAADVASRLAAMCELDLLRRDDSSGEYAFKHALVCDALYGGLLSGPRQELHLAVAREIERRDAGRLAEVAETLAYHYARADHSDKAAEYLSLVGHRNLTIYSVAEAEQALRQALTLARADDAERMDTRVASILVDLAVAYYMQMRATETIALIEPELDRLRVLGDDPRVPILLDLYGIALFTDCRFRAGRAMVDQALAMAERLDDGRAKAHARAGVIMLSNYVDPMPADAFEVFAHAAYNDAQHEELTYLVVRMTMVVSMHFLHRGLVREGREWAHRLMRFGEDREDRRSLGMAQWLLGYGAIVSREYQTALAHGEECVRVAPVRYDQEIGRVVMGIAQLLLGRVAEGNGLLREHRDHAIANGWRYSALTAAAPLGVGLLLSGKLRRGVRQLRALIRRCEREYDYPDYADWARVFLAEFYLVLLRGGGGASWRVILSHPVFLPIARWRAARRAEALLARAVRNPRFDPQGVHRARIELDFGLLRLAQGRWDEAMRHLLDARAAAVAQEAVGLTAEVDAALARLNLAPPTNATAG